MYQLRSGMIAGRGALDAAAAVGGGYTGPGDIVTFLSWWGLRGYNAAYATGSNPAIDVVDQAGAHALTVNILANGNLDVASVSAWVTTNSVTTIKITKWYDQTGGGRHFVNTTIAQIPALTLNGLGTLPISTWTAAGDYLVAYTASATQPFSISAVARRTSTFTATNPIIAFGGSMGAVFHPAADTLQFYANSQTTQGSVPDNVFHAVQFIANGAAGNIYVDGASNIKNAGTNALNSETVYRIGGNGFGEFLFGNLCEVGVAQSGFSVAGGGIASQLNTNQHTYWGF